MDGKVLVKALLILDGDGMRAAFTTPMAMGMALSHIESVYEHEVEMDGKTILCHIVRTTGRVYWVEWSRSLDKATRGR